MIVKDTTTIVRFYVTTTDGFPATGQSSNISASISLDGGTAIAITATITESDSTNLPGWYEFEHTFGTAGNAFITFACNNCMIMPWEDEVVELSGSSAPSAAEVADAVWDEIVFGRTPMVTDSAADVLITAAATGTPASIWQYPNRSLTSEVLTRDENYQPTKTLAISSELTTAKDAILTRGNSAWTTATGFSTFNSATDSVTINATQAATMVTATGFATPSDIPSVADITTAVWSDKASYASSTKGKTLGDIKVLAMAIPSGVWAETLTGYGADAAGTRFNAMLSDYATATNVSTAQTAIISAMPDVSGLSTFDPSTDTVTIDSTQAATMVTADVSGLATSADIPTSDITAIKTKVDSLQNTDLTGIATATNVTTAQQAIITHGDSNWTGGGSGGSGATPAQIWGYENRTLTASPTDVSALATASDLANSTSTLQTLLTNILAGLYHWRVKNNVLTIYNDSDAIIATFSITRDPTGNIIAVTPINN